MRIRWGQALLVVVVLLTFGGAAVIVGARRNHQQTAPAAAPSLGDPRQLAKIARTRLPSTTATPAVDVTSTVATTFAQDQQIYLGELTLWLACAGAGEITLVVSGKPSTGEGNGGPPLELSRASTECGPDSPPVRAAFTAGGGYEKLVLTLADSDSAVGRAGFAYRITSDTGKPLTPADEKANPTYALHLPLNPDPDEDTGYGMGGNVDADATTADTAPLHGRYTLAAACAGIGTLYVQAGEQKAVVKCSWPPKRQDFRLGTFSGPDPVVRIVYRSTSRAPADFALQFIPR